MRTGIEEIFGNKPIGVSTSAIRDIPNRLADRIVGQQVLIERLVISLLCSGHLLLEGFPGLAKTRSVKELANFIEGEFHRVQFTPDLLPADLTGTDVYRPQTASFEFKKGPLFHEIILADEINRAPAKVQSALLEAMEERQITVGSKTYPLPDLFMVMATQNPIEHEGTYMLPEAQRDRFLMQVRVWYPDKSDEHEILKIARTEASRTEPSHSGQISKVTYQQIATARNELLALHMEPSVERYIIELVDATRNSSSYSKQIAELIEVGASPRGTIALDMCSRAKAWLAERDYVSPADVQDVALDVLRHRLLLTYEAEAQNVDVDDIIRQLISVVAVP